MEDLFAGFIAVHYAVFLTFAVLIAFIASLVELLKRKEDEKS